MLRCLRLDLIDPRSSFSLFTIISPVSPLLHRLLTLDLTNLAAAEMARSSSETSLASSHAGSSTAVSTAGDWANDDTELLIKSESSTPCHHSTRYLSYLNIKIFVYSKENKKVGETVLVLKGYGPFMFALNQQTKS